MKEPLRKLTEELKSMDTRLRSLTRRTQQPSVGVNSELITFAKALVSSLAKKNVKHTLLEEPKK